jgi:hypothetical protein
MVEAFQHLLGACGDNHSHFDLIDLLFMGSGAMGMYSLRYYTVGTYLIIKNYIKNGKL